MDYRKLWTRFAAAAAALLLLFLRHSTLAIGYILLLLGVLIAIRQLAGVELYASARLIRNGLIKPRRGLLINLVHPFIDFFLIGVSFVTACWTTCGTAGNLQIFLCTFGPLALLLCLSGTYRVLLAAGRNQRLLPAENAAASRFGPGLFAAVSARISEYGAAVQH